MKKTSSVAQIQQLQRHPTSSEATPCADSPNENNTRLEGSWAVFARIVWVTFTLFIICLFVVAIPVRFHELQQLCVLGMCNVLQLSPGDIPALKQVTFSLSAYSTYMISLEVTYTLSYILVAALIFWRHSDNWMALLVSLTFVALGTTLPPVIEALAREQPAWRFPALFLQELAPFCLVMFLYLFPNGRFVPRWTGLLALGWTLWSLIRPFFIQTTPFSLDHFEILVMVSLFAVGALAQLYRYKYVSTPGQQQQTKWVVFSLGILVLGGVVYVLIHLLFSPLNQPGLAHILGNMFSVPICLTLPGLLVALTLGIAILRYQLWDIDLLINRTLVYGTLTATLALLYLGLVMLLHAAFVILTSQHQSEPVVVVSTLVIAALFQPLRRHIQIIIDRRFYRHKYDAARTITAFSETLRREVDLDQLNEHLLAVIQETMQPSRVFLWVRTPILPKDSTTRILPELSDPI